MSLSLAATVAAITRDNSPLEYASELYEPWTLEVFSLL